MPHHRYTALTIALTGHPNDWTGLLPKTAKKLDKGMRRDDYHRVCRCLRKASGNITMDDLYSNPAQSA